MTSEPYLLSDVVEQSTQPFALLDLHGGFVRCNRAFERLTGFSSDELWTMTYQQLTPPPWHSLEAKKIAHILTTGEAVRYEKEYQRKDGRLVPVELVVDRYRNAGGEGQFFFAFVIDITERKKLEQDLRQRVQELAEGEERMRSVVNHVVDGIITIDEHGTIRTMNPAAEQLFGYPASDMIGRNVKLLMPEPYHSEHDGYLRSYLQSGQARIIGIGREVVGRRKDGSTFPMDLAVSEFRLGDQRYFTGIVRDITERKKAEAELREAEERMRSVVSHVVDGIITIDECGVVESFNPAAERIFGYQAAEVMGQNVKLLMPEPYHGEHDGYLRNYLQSGQAKIIGIGREVVGRRKDGSTFPMDLAVSTFCLGERRYFTGIVREITERKRLEQEVQQQVQELAEAEERMRSVVNHVVDGIISIDEHGTVATLNPAAEKIFGYQAAEVIGQNVKLLMPEPFHSEHDGYLRSYLQSGQAKIIGIGREVVGRRKDGSTFPMDLAVSEFRLGDQRYFTGIVRDITERRKAEESLREQAELLDLAHDAIIVRSTEGIITFWNHGAEQMYGWQKEAVLGKTTHSLLQTEFPQPLPEIEAELAQHGWWEGTLIHTRQDGSRIAVASRWSLRRGEAGKAPIILEINEDITERKRAEAALKESAEDLARSNLDLEQFAYVASHDLQEPLRAVSGCVQVLQKRYQGKLDERADELIAHTVEGVSRMQGLINDLLAYSRVGTRGKAFKAADSNAILKQALANLQVAVTEAGAVVTHDDLPLVQVDAAQLTQVFQNLLGNALKFHSPEQPRIHVGVQRQVDHWLFRIQDNGIGIQPEYFERIFVLFQRLHTRNEYPGTGIGLAICKKIVERHGGRISVESEPGKGSTFFFTIPER